MIGTRVKRWKEVDIPVIDGTAHLPDGRTIASQSQIVRVPVLTGNRLYERIVKWRVDVKLSGAIRIPEDAAMRAVIDGLAGPLKSRRGATYVPFGPTVFGGIGEVGDDFFRNERTATGWRMARYVRPEQQRETARLLNRRKA